MLQEALNQCRRKVRESGGSMSLPFYNEHQALGNYVSVEIDKQHSSELEAVLNQWGFEYRSDKAGSFMDFYSITVK